MNALPYGLLSVDQIMAHVNARANYRENVEVESAADLGLHYREPSQENAKGGFYATVPVTMANGQTKMQALPLSDGAVKTACKLIGQGDPKFFAQGDDPDFFPKTFRHVIDSTKRKQRGMLLRHNKDRITSILPRDYVVKDADKLLGDFIPALQENVGQIVGVLGIEQGDDGDSASYRIVMGNNIMPSLADDKGQYLMFNINTSESGLFDTKTSLGLYRTFCTNSAIRVQTLSRWDHRSAFSPFYDKAARTIREAGYLQDSYGKIFEELLREKLPFPAPDLIDAFRREQLIATDHAKLATVYSETEPSETQYDLFNILTRSAQDLPSIRAREDAEVRAMNIFTQPGGVLEALRRAENKKGRRKNVGPLLEDGSNE